MNEWHPHEETLAKAEWLAGRSASEIAKQLPGRTRNAVIGRIHRLGLSKEGRANAKAPQKATYVPRLRKPKPAPIAGVSATLTWSSAKSTTEDQRVFAEEGHTATARVASGVGVESPDAKPMLLARSGCKWPLGDRYAIRYCCNPLLGGESVGKVYCEGHARIAVAAIQPPRPQGRDATRATRFERIEKQAEKPRAANDASIWDDAREVA